MAFAGWGPILRSTPQFGRVLAATMTVVFLASGSVIFYNMNVLNPYTTDADVLAWRADYEKTYKTFAARPQPHVAAIKTDVDLFPSERRLRVRGEYVLVNDTSRPIDEILVAVRRDASATNVTMPSSRMRHDQRFNQYVFELDRPLAPGQQTTVQFDVTYDNPGFESEESPDPMIVENGSYIMSFRAFPTIGYRASYEIQNARERRRQGLPASTAYDSSREFLPHDEIQSVEWIDFDATVSTAGDQTALAPGRLLRTWKHNGRNSFHYRSDRLIPNQFAIGSGRYAIARETHHGVSIEIYHHPEHTQNLAPMMRAASQSLSYFIDNFGPYPHPHLRLVEVPAQYQSFSGFAQPGMIFLGEIRGFLIDGRNTQNIDLLYRRVAHEVAHQWWGHQLVATHGPGATFLTESLTKYSEIVTLEKAHGREQVRQLLTFELDLYLAGRTDQVGEEPPLARTDNQSYLYYRKGALVMNALRDLLGEATVNRALRNLLLEQAGPNRNPTTSDFLRHLHAVAQPSQHALIDEWMNDVVLYNFKLESANSRRLPNGRYAVTLRVTALKERADDQPLPMRELIDIGIFSDDDQVLHLAKHALHEGRQDLTVIVDHEPLRAAVDPYVCRIDRNRFDNSRRVETR
jgi:hypothetical protein